MWSTRFACGVDPDEKSLFKFELNNLKENCHLKSIIIATVIADGTLHALLVQKVTVGALGKRRVSGGLRKILQRRHGRQIGVGILLDGLTNVVGVYVLGARQRVVYIFQFDASVIDWKERIKEIVRNCRKLIN